MKRLGLAIILASMTFAGFAKDLGQLGPVYPIGETSVLKDITDALKAKEASGELAQTQRKVQDMVKQAIEHPRAVMGLGTAKKEKVYWFDPSITVEENIVDATGRIVVPAGTTKNPLDIVRWDKRWLFIDGRDDRQVRLARSAVEEYGRQVKVILTAGAPLELSRKWKWPVYFDQRGMYVQHFGIGNVPAWVYQDGKKLRITEVPPK
jgi:conjugal transfer pilus assembly protein TraW